MLGFADGIGLGVPLRARCRLGCLQEGWHVHLSPYEDCGPSMASGCVQRRFVATHPATYRGCSSKATGEAVDIRTL
jgi:hypothetical protein